MLGSRRLAEAVNTTARSARAAARRAGTATRRTGRYLRRQVRHVRTRSANGELGMARLLDLHAVSCAGDALVAIGLAGTIFFSVPVGEARHRVALYLLVTMAPFALLAPVVGPVLDRFRHGRRYALASTMLGRGFLAWVISDNLGGIGLYPAAFGMLVLSRSYGVARSAAVPRLLPSGLGLVEANARASLFGTVAGALIAPVGVALFYLGPQWTLRLGSVVFLIGMVVALRLPPRADSDPPEAVPRILRVLRSGTGRVLTGRLVTLTVTGSAALRFGYGFLLLFLAFRIREGDFGARQELTIGAVAVALAAGSLTATALCTRRTVRRPLPLQAVALLAVVLTGGVAAWWYAVVPVVALCLVTALAGGVAKLALDAVIQERLPENVRASSFAHSETLLILAWVAGGGVGLIPLSGKLGLLVLVSAFTLLAAYLSSWAVRLPDQELGDRHGTPGTDADRHRTAGTGPDGHRTAGTGPDGSGSPGRRGGAGTRPVPGAHQTGRLIEPPDGRRPADPAGGHGRGSEL